MTNLVVCLFLSAAWLVFGTLSVVGLVGKPRNPITPSSAVVSVIVMALIVTVVLTAAFTLLNGAGS